MQIVIPMSGYGERFRLAGYQVPKPLIIVDGKPIISHVVDLFDSQDKFIFICNKDHINNKRYKMKEILISLAENIEIVEIEPHKLGPVYAVTKAFKFIRNDEPVIVNYCDFSCYWNYDSFLKFTQESQADGIIPSYKGFHPHTLWSNYYAYSKLKNDKVIDIQEKTPFTDKPREEYASSGTYFFKNGYLLKHYFNKTIEDKLKVNGEYYVSLVYKTMLNDNLRVNVYEIEHFMQWGVPYDLEEYQYWSDIFQKINTNQPKQLEGNLLIPIAGEGRRFSDEGYEDPKPLIPVSGKFMALQAYDFLPRYSSIRFVTRDNLPKNQLITRSLKDEINNLSIISLEGLTNGQATTCYRGLVSIPLDESLTIAACDNGHIYSFPKLLKLYQDDDFDIIIWGARGYPGASRNPEMYGWIDLENNSKLIKSISVKKPLKNVYKDPIVTGTFTFKKAEYFKKSYESMKHRGGLVNNEYYIDELINDAVSLGYKCALFEVDYYICWGTPNDLKTFNYWQSCFNKWKSHPYSINEDKYAKSYK